MQNNSSSSSSSTSFLHSSHNDNSTTFPITAVAIIGILATAFLLLSYYIFVIKCCLNWHRIDLLGRFSFSGRHRPNEDVTLVNSSSPEENRGLDEAIIRSIPIFQYKKNGVRKRSLVVGDEKCLSECAICLNEFQDDEKLRVLPNCSHIFHIDCIDIWLQSNANCPLCRTCITADTTTTTTSRFGLSPGFSRNDDDFLIEISDNEESTSKVEEEEEEETGDSNVLKRKKRLKCVTSMGDECIDICRGDHGNNNNKDEGIFDTLQPIRRSFSMDSASDPQLHLAIQLILQQQQQLEQQVIVSSPRSTVRRVPFFSFGHDRTSRRTSAVLPLHLES